MNTKSASLDWMDFYCIADVAARVLRDERTSKHPDRTPATRTYMRAAAVGALRALWRRGDIETRRTVIGRTMVWLYGETDNFNCGPRIERVVARIEGRPA